ncbi:hypothetical protein [Streptomyces sp. CAU 1734]|uniref:hypothetical protein n=1 Tax=Streptomyces sp. CAU 1734 TaxID=3140360 RepID=UPI003260B965
MSRLDRHRPDHRVALCSTVRSEDILTAGAGDRVRVEDGGEGSSRVRPCAHPVPWDKAYKVASVGAENCAGGTARAWTSDDRKKAITPCLREIDVWE